MAEYTLPDLPYDYSALAPHISAKIMELHHSKHHNTYVTGANTANAALAEARSTGDLANVNKLEKDLAFNLGGHVNHSIFWTNLAPETSEPTGDLLEAIGRDFGDLEKFKAHFTATALGGGSTMGENTPARLSTSQRIRRTRGTIAPRSRCMGPLSSS